LRKRTKTRHKATLVGVGAMGSRHARVLGALSDRFELVGAYDIRSDARPPPGVPWLRREAEAIAAADVVVVATPVEAHGGTVTKALAAGKHVLVEKPLCATAAEALALDARAGGRLFVGHSERFNPVVRALARLVRDDAVLSIDLGRLGPSRPSDLGVLINLGVHDFDLAAYFGGGDLTLHASLGRGAEGLDRAHVLFTTANGALGHLLVDRTSPTRLRTIALVSSRWIYEGDLLAYRLSRTPRAGGSSTEVPLPLDEPLAAQAAALADALDGNAGRELATGLDGARAVGLAEKAAALCHSGPAVGNGGKGAKGAPDRGAMRGTVL
jgi:predicted dehydrogenase